MRYEYVCPEGHVTEKNGGLDDVQAPCSCGEIARRREFNLAALVGATVMKEQKFPVSRFQEAAAEVDYYHTKLENAGAPVKRPDLWGMAKREARKRGAKVR